MALLVARGAGAPARAADDALSEARLAPVRKYIKDGWTTLTRVRRDIVRAAPDPKLHLPPGPPWPVYVSAREDRARVERELTALLSPEQRKQIDLRVLPKDPLSVTEHGLLYLPHPYVVPGGRFNEMYGWDSYFIQVGLLLDGETDKARELVDNFLYEIDHYGTILNANRTYFLSRSQPPFLTRMLLGVYEKTGDREVAGGRLAGGREVLRVLDDRAAPRPHDGPLALLRRRRHAGRRGGERREGRGGAHPLRPRARVLQDAHGRGLRRRAVLRREEGRADAALLPRRPLDARVGLRPVEPLRPLQRRHRPPRAGLPERAALRDGGGRRAHRPRAREGRGGLDGPRAKRHAAVDRYLWDEPAGALPRLQLRDREAPRLPLRDHVLPAVGGPRLARAGAARASGRRRSWRRRAAS